MKTEDAALGLGGLISAYVVTRGVHIASFSSLVTAIVPPLIPFLFIHAVSKRMASLVPRSPWAGALAGVAMALWLLFVPRETGLREWPYANVPLWQLAVGLFVFVSIQLARIRKGTFPKTVILDRATLFGLFEAAFHIIGASILVAAVALRREDSAWIPYALALSPFVVVYFVSTLGARLTGSTPAAGCVAALAMAIGTVALMPPATTDCSCSYILQVHCLLGGGLAVWAVTAGGLKAWTW